MRSRTRSRNAPRCLDRFGHRGRVVALSEFLSFPCRIRTIGISRVSRGSGPVADETVTGRGTDEVRTRRGTDDCMVSTRSKGSALSSKARSAPVGRAGTSETAGAAFTLPADAERIRRFRAQFLTKKRTWRDGVRGERVALLFHGMLAYLRIRIHTLTRMFSGGI